MTGFVVEPDPAYTEESFVVEADGFLVATSGAAVFYNGDPRGAAFGAQIFVRALSYGTWRDIHWPVPPDDPDDSGDVTPDTEPPA